MVEDSEEEINEMRAIILRTGAAQIQKLETEKSAALIELKDVKEQLSAAKSESSKKFIYLQVFIFNLIIFHRTSKNKTGQFIN